MNYRMERVFCAAAGELEPERAAFHDVVGEVNGAAMERGRLLVPVSVVPKVRDQRAFQASIDSNVRNCRVFVLVLGEDWGPPEHNFQHQFELAQESCERVAVLRKAGSVAPQAGDDVLVAEYSDLASFREALRGVLAEWAERA